MAAIVTVYGADGKKTRRPIGYSGGQCNVATAPYEAREIHGQTKKDATAEFYEDEPKQTVGTSARVSGE